MSVGTGADFAAFEAAVDRALGDRLRSDDAACPAMWSALANTEWTHADGGIVGYTFRHESEIVATIRGRGHILEWSCSRPTPSSAARSKRP